MRITIGFFLFIQAVASLAQTNKPDPGKQEKPAVSPVESPPAPSVNTSQLLRHFYNKYATALRWNDSEVAKSALYDMILMNPANDSIVFSLAFYYYENRQYASALLISQDLLAINPKNTSYLEVAASSAEELGVHDRALQYFESLYLLTNTTATLYKIAFLQYSMKRMGESNVNVDILLTKPDVNTLKVIYNDTAGKPKEYPMKVAVLNLKGLLDSEKGDKTAARKSFTDALALAADFVPAKDNLEKLK